MRHLIRNSAGLGAALAVLSCSDSTGPATYEFEITPEVVAIPQYGTQQLSVDVLDQNGSRLTGVAVTYESSDDDIVAVTRSGFLTSVGPAGGVTIWVRAGASERGVPVTVTPIVGRMSVTPEAVTLPQLTARSVEVRLFDLEGNEIPGASFEAVPGNAAMVAVEGSTVRSLGPAGQTSVSFRRGTVTATLGVTITQVAASLTVLPSPVVIGQGRSRQLAPSLRDVVGATMPGGTFTYESSDEAIATVSPSGVVRSTGPLGTANITVRSGPLPAVTVPVNVVAIPPIHGEVAARVPLAGTPYGAAVSSAGMVYIGHLAGSISRAQLPSFTISGATTGDGSVHAIAFNAAGTLAFASGGARGAGIRKIDVATNTVVGTFTGTRGETVDVVVSPDDQTVYVSTLEGWVIILNAATLAVIAESSVGTGIVHLARHPSLPRVFASAQRDGRVYELDAVSGQVLGSYVTSGAPQKVIVSPDGSLLYIANEDGNLQAWTISSRTLASSIPLGCGGWGMAMTPDGEWLFVSCTLAGRIVRVHRATVTPTETIVTNGQPRRMAVSPDGTTLVVANESGWVDFIQ